MVARLLPLFCLLTLAAVPSAGQPTLPSGEVGRDSTHRPVFGTATTPSVRPLALAPDVARRGELAWTLTFTEPNGPGSALAGSVAAAPDGGVCTLSLETRGGVTGGPVVARYGPGGVEQWARPVLEWASPLTSQLRDVAAVGDACIAVAVLYGSSSSRLEIARVDTAGVTWTHIVEAPTPDWAADRAYVQPDGAGGVWVGAGSSAFPPPPTLLTRIDATGAEVVRVVRDPAETPPSWGVRGLAVHPDGRAVAISDADLLFVVDLAGTVVSVPGDPDFTPMALALDHADASPAAFVVGVTAGGVGEVRRIGLDGVTAWTTELGEGAPTAVTVRNGDAYVTWVALEGPQLVRLGGANGDAVWQTPLPDEMVETQPAALVADESGVVMWTVYPYPNSYRIAYTSDGDLRWIEGEAVREARPHRMLVACGSGATCLFGTGFYSAPLVARGPDGEVEWSVHREGESAPHYGLYDAVLAPNGDVYLSGGTVTEAGGNDFFVVRVTSAGAFAWAVAVDGGGTSESAWRMDVAPDGEIVVTGWSNTSDGSRSPLVARLNSDGTADWVTTVDLGGNYSEPTGIVAGLGGGAAVVAQVVSEGGKGTPILARLDGNGDLAWTLPLTASPDFLYPWRVLRVPDGYAVGLGVYSSEGQALRVDRFTPDGALNRSDIVTGTGSCEVSSVEADFGADAAGVVYGGGSLSNGPQSCARPTVFRFGPNGVEGHTHVGPVGGAGFLYFRTLDVRPDGATVVAYEGSSSGSGLAWIGGGEVVWDVLPIAEDVAVQAVAAGPEAEAFAGGDIANMTLSGFDARALSYAPDSGAEIVDIPRVEGLSTRTQHALLGPEGEGYVILNANTFGVQTAGVARVDGAVSTDVAPTPAPSAQALQVIGPNPVRAGSTFRLRGGRLGVGKPVTLTLYDVLGRRVATWPDAEAVEVELPIPNVPTGVYFLRVSTEDEAETARLTIVR